MNASKISMLVTAALKQPKLSLRMWLDPSYASLVAVDTYLMNNILANDTIFSPVSQKIICGMNICVSHSIMNQKSRRMQEVPSKANPKQTFEHVLSTSVVAATLALNLTQ